MDKRLAGLLAKNPEAAKSSEKIKAALALIQRLRGLGVSKEGYRLRAPADSRLPQTAPKTVRSIRPRYARSKLTHNA